MPMETAQSRPNHSWLKFFFLLTSVLLVYSFSLGGDFKTDDRFSITLNPLIRDFSHIGEIFTRGYFGDQAFYRPFVYLTYLIEYSLFNVNAFCFGLDNILIHFCNALLVWLVVKEIISEKDTGFWAAFLFAIHPVQWEAVANISGRSVLLSTFFSLTAFYAFMRSLDFKSGRWMAAAAVSFGLALLNKESAAVLPLVMALYVFFLRRKDVSSRDAGINLLPSLLVLAGYLLLRIVLGLDQVYVWPTWQEKILGFITFLRSLITHAREMVWPVGLYFDRSQAIYPSFEQMEILYVLLFWSLVVVQGWIWRRYIKPIDVFCILWALVELLPVSQLVGAIGVSPGYISAADHFLYMPAIPLSVLLIRAIGCVSEFSVFRTRVSPWILKIVLAAFAAFFMTMNIQQNYYAREEQAMLERSLSYQPNNARLHNLAGYLAAVDRDLRRAELHFFASVRLNPMDPSARISLGKALCDQNRLGEGLIQYLSVVDPGPYADLLKDNMRYPTWMLESRILAGEALSQSDWLGWGLYKVKMNQPREAIVALENVLKLNDRNTQALILLARAYEQDGRLIEARNVYRHLMEFPELKGVSFDFVIDHLARLKLEHPEVF